MDKLPPLPAKSSSDAPVNPLGENAVKQPAGGAKSEFPRLLAETPAARKVSGADADQAEGDVSSALPPEAAGGKELPPGPLPDAPPETSTDAPPQALAVALPPGLLWAPVAGASGAPPVPPTGPGVIEVPATQHPVAPQSTDVLLGSSTESPGHPDAGPLPLPSAGQAATSGFAALLPKPPDAPGSGIAQMVAADGSPANPGAVEVPPIPGLAPDASSSKAMGLDIDAGMGVRLAQPTAEAPSAARAAPAVDAIDIPVGRPGWDHQLGSRILWVVRDQLQHAELRLNPPHLGPLEVRLSVQPDQSVNLGFSAAQVQVRDAIEAALPRLREMLADGGLNLGDVNVSSHSRSGTGGERESRQANTQDYRSAADSADEMVATAVVGGRGLVDFFA